MLMHIVDSHAVMGAGLEVWGCMLQTLSEIL